MSRPGSLMQPVFGWGRVARLGLVQAALGAVVALTTSTLNRVMVVELALPALLPGMLVAFHYLVQVVRPRMGHGADVGGRHTPWIVGGIGVLALGGLGAGAATAWMASERMAGIVLAVLSFALIGIGVSASGTSLLALLAKRVEPERRAASATLVWMMMIAGIVVTAGLSGQALDPYTPARLVAVTAAVSLIAFAIAALAMLGVEGKRAQAVEAVPAAAPRASFAEALRAVWSDRAARHFTLFVFVSMLAYSAQDLILEPFAGAVFTFTPGESTKLSGVQHGGVLAGMLIAAFAGSRWKGRALGSLKAWTIGGCLASALALGALVVAGLAGQASYPLRANVFLLGLANGVFSIAAIGSMMRLAGEGGGAREGVRMGVWGAAQAVAFGLGGLLGTGASDLAHWLIGDSAAAYASVFAFESLLFVAAAAMAASIAPLRSRAVARSSAIPAGPQGQASPA